MKRNTLLLMFVGALIVFAYDLYAALHNRSAIGAGISYLLAAVMAVFAFLALRKILRQDYSNSMW